MPEGSGATCQRRGRAMCGRRACGCAMLLSRRDLDTLPEIRPAPGRVQFTHRPSLFHACNNARACVNDSIVSPRACPPYSPMLAKHPRKSRLGLADLGPGSGGARCRPCDRVP